MEIDYFYLFRKYKKFFILFVIAATIVSFIFVYKELPTYEATAKIYINESSNLRIAYAAIKSNRIYDAVISQLDLIKVFKVDNTGQARKILSRNLQTVLDSRIHTVDIKFRWRDGALAAETANAFILKLQEIYPEIRLPETAGEPLDFKIIDKAIAPIEPMDQHGIEIIVLSVVLSVIVAVFFTVLAEKFSSRGSKEEQ